MDKHSLVRTVYLYLFSLLGLVLLIIGGVRFVDMGLRAFIFKQADEERRIFSLQPPFSPLKIEKLAEGEGENIAPKAEVILTEKEKQIFSNWLQDYKSWQERAAKIDPITAQRQRDASTNLAFILVGAPLYIFHWRIIRRETRG